MAKQWVVVVLLAFVTFARADDAPPVPLPIRAPNDKSEYRRFVLENGLRVLLCSDPKLNRASAALAIDAGSFDEPAGRPGLAHFLEHMLFLGTEKYPAEADYRSYIESNGGAANGFTQQACTIYPFEIRPEAFENALDRFSQFFIAPLLDPTFTEREINAVHNEAQRYADNDLPRIARVEEEICRVGTPQQRFSTGNRETLVGTSHEELLAFFRSHYVPERMALVLRSTHSLDRLEAWARQYFSSLRGGAPAVLNRPRDFFPQSAGPALLRIEPLQDIRQLRVQFVTDSSRAAWAAKSSALIGRLIGYEGPGSLLAALKEEGLATALSTGVDSSVPSYDRFIVSIELTPAGLAQVDRVLTMLFAQAELLRRSPLPTQVFYDSALLARLDETWREHDEGYLHTAELAGACLTFPLALAERVPFLWLAPDEADYRRRLNALRPENMFATLVAKGLPCDREERFYGVRYGYGPEGSPPLTALQNPPVFAALHLPPPNPFLPGDVGPLPLEPTPLIAEPGLSVYHLQDTEFRRPLVAFVLRVRPERPPHSAQDWVLAAFYKACVLEAANLVAYDAQQAGVEYTLDVDAEGVFMSVTGYHGSAEKCLSYLATQLRSVALDAPAFAAIKDRIRRLLESFARAEAYEQGLARHQAVLRDHAFVPDQVAALAAGISPADVQAYAESLLGRARVEMLVHGNCNSTAATAAARDFAASLGSAPPTGPTLARLRQLAQPAGSALLDTASIRGSNSCCSREYEYPQDTPETRAAARVIGQFLAEPFFTELRTRQQLGYIVESAYNSDRHHLYQFFLVQSADFPPTELRHRMDDFISTIAERWRAQPPEQFATLVAGARAQLEAKDTSIGERAARLFTLAFDYDADWGRNDATLAALAKLTPTRVGEILAGLLDPRSARLREVLLAGEPHHNIPLPLPTFTDREAWKVTRTYR